MGFLDTLDKLKDKTVDLAQAGVAQSKRVAEMAKLKTDNMAEEDTIKKAYIEIGKLYYAEKGMTAEGAYASACEKITAARAAIEANKDRIAELRNEVDDDDDEATVIPPKSEVTAEDIVDEIKEEVEDLKDDIADELKD